MDNVSPGVAQVSQFGATTLIEQEYAAAGSNILNSFKSQRINGAGETTGELDVDKNHQWVSTVTMLAPSLDRMVGVADLRLCYGHDWKRSVKVCSELFSTATRSERFHPPMQRNSIQWNNCSFGYFEFTFKEYKNSSQEIPKKTDLGIISVKFVQLQSSLASGHSGFGVINFAFFVVVLVNLIYNHLLVEHVLHAGKTLLLEKHYCMV